MNLPVVASSSLRISPFRSLPQEVVGHLLSFLDLQGIQNLSQTSKRLLKATIAETNIKDRIVMDSCIDIVCSRLDNKTQSEQKKSLLELKPSAIRRFPNLLEAKMSISSLKNRIMDVLMTLNKGELTALEGISVPGFCKSIGCLVEICKRIPVANSIQSSSIRDRALQVISTDLAAAGETDKALEVANSIPDKFMRKIAFSAISEVLRNIFRDLVAAGEINKALEVAGRMPDEVMRRRSFSEISQVLGNVSRYLIAAGEIDKALEVARRMPDRDRREHALWEISEVLGAISRDLIAAGEIDRALELARRMPDEMEQGNAFRQISRTLQNISKDLAAVGEIDKAIKEAHRIPYTCMMGCALRDISKVLIEASEIDKALEVAKSILDKDARIEALQNVSVVLLADVLLTEGKIDKIHEISNSIRDHYDRYAFFWTFARDLYNISKALASVGEIDKAIKVAKNILDEMLRDSALEGIYPVLIGAGELDKAFDVANIWDNRHARENAFQDISQALVKERKFDRAIEVANHIKTQSIRIIVLEDIRRQKSGPLSKARNWVKKLLNVK